jgi:hypothetical protein
MGQVFPTVPFSRDGKPLAVNQTVSITGVITSLNGAVDDTTPLTVQLQYSGNTISVESLDIAAVTQTT